MTTPAMRSEESARHAHLAASAGLLRYMATLVDRVPPGHFDACLDDAIKHLMVGSHAGRIGE